MFYFGYGREKEVTQIVISATEMIKKQLLDALNARRNTVLSASLDGEVLLYFAKDILYSGFLY